MSTRSAGVALALFVLAAPLARGAEGTPDVAVPPAAQPVDQLIREAREAWYLRRDPNAALRAFGKAIEAEPKSLDAIRARATFLADLVKVVSSAEQRKQLEALERHDWQAVIELAPDTMSAGLARDHLRRMDGKHGVAERAVTCSEEATGAFAEAERLYAAGRFPDALIKYRLAADRCPASASIWMGFGDAYYGAADYEMAKTVFLRGLEADPWHRLAHRFLADAETHLDHPDAAWRESILSVLSDPFSESSWAALRQTASNRGRAWWRVHAEKVEVKLAKDTAGKIKVDIKIPTESLGKKTADGDTDPDGAAWMMYGMHKAGVLSGTFDLDGTKLEGAGAATFHPSPFEIERAAAKKALIVLDELHEVPEKIPFWRTMRAAQAAGHLDDAVYLLLLDEDLVPEYVLYRDAHRESLVAFVETVVAPKREPQAAPAPPGKP